jgi:hypothetical protein
MSENQKPSGRGTPPITPRWVKLLIISFIMLVLLVVILHLLGFGFGSHGAGRTLLDDFIHPIQLTKLATQRL